MSVKQRNECANHLSSTGKIINDRIENISLDLTATDTISTALSNQHIYKISD